MDTSKITSNPIFLFRQELIRDREGNYFDGEDPYREYQFEYYTQHPDTDKKVRFIMEKQILSSCKKYKHDERPYKEEEIFFEEFTKKHSGQNVVVLSVNGPVYKKGIVEEAVFNYEKYGRVYKELSTCSLQTK